MQLLIGLFAVVALALVSSSRLFWSLRRTRIGAVMFTGGWLIVGTGMLLGWDAIGLVRDDQILLLRPLIHFCLGLVGVMVGLQLRRDVLANLPGRLVWLIVWDALASWMVIGGGVAGVWWIWREPFASLGGCPGVLVLLGVLAIGWSAEVRSLRRRGRLPEEAEKIIRAGAGLGSVAALVIYGMLFTWLVQPDNRLAGWVGAMTCRADWAVVLPAVFNGMAAVAVAVVCGCVSWGLLGLAENRESHLLVILLGITAFMAGAANVLGLSTLAVGLLTGAMLTNLPRRTVGRLNRVILEAEQPVAMALMLVAGLLVEGAPHWGLWMVVAMVLVGRLAIKTALVGRAIRRMAGAERTGVVWGGPLRQNPLALAMGVELVVRVMKVDPHMFRHGLLVVVIAVGLISELLSLVGRKWSADNPTDRQEMIG